MKKFVIAGISAVLPTLVLAQTTVQLGYWQSLLRGVAGIINTLVGILIAGAVIFFIWNVLKYIRAADGDKKAEAAKGMLWGVIGLAVIVSVWGLVGLLQTTFQVGTPTNTVDTGKLIPTINTSGN